MGVEVEGVGMRVEGRVNRGGLLGADWEGHG